MQPVEPQTDLDEEEEETPRKISRKKLLAVLAALVIVGSVVAYYVVFANQAPVARFTFSAVDKRLSTSADTSYDPDGRIVTYLWSWGDQASATGIRAAHTYANEGTYTVKLTVRDDRSAEGAHTESVEIVVRPTADFDVSVDRMSIDVDGSLSVKSPTGGDITGWSWDFGDGGAASGVQAAHSYTTAGRYPVTLTVTDSSGRNGNVSRYVSPAATTVDVKLNQAFTTACPFGSYWAWRNGTYGDQIVRNTAPCVDYYPWVLFTDSPSVNPSFLYTLYHRVSRVRNHPGYSVQDPVILPVNNSAVVPDATSYIQFNLSLEYMGEEWRRALNNTPYDPNLFGDGFDMLMRGNITMDLTMSRRIFGVNAATPADAQLWWWQNTGFARSTKPAEAYLAQWIETQGNGKFNIWEGFEWELVVDMVDLNGTVSPDGTTRVQVWAMVYGLDALWMRWWYWGRADYSDAVSRPFGEVQPQGWAPEELCWCEHATMVGNITDHLDLDFSADAAYQWEAWANSGPDQTWNTPDDQPAWVYEPAYLDYVPSSGCTTCTAQGKYYTSELHWWEGQRTFHATPGSYSYGRQYEYMVAPARFKFDPGYTLTIRMPQGNIPWFDPVQSTWNPVRVIGDYVITYAPVTLRFVEPAGAYFLWDPRTKVVSFAGPYDYGGATGAPTMSAPWVEMQPEAVG